MAADLAAKYGAELTVLHVLMHGEPPAELQKMALVEHLVDETPPETPTPGVAGTPLGGVGRTDFSHVEHQRISFEIISALGQRVAANAVAAARDKGADNVTSRIREGDTADQILSACQDDGADLVVLGSRGLGTLGGLLLGSISQKVSQLAACPCLIVR